MGIPTTIDRIVVGTAAGLHRVGGGTELAGHAVTAVSGAWALVGGDTVWHGGVLGEPIEGPPARCLVAHDGGALVGTAEAHLVAVSAAGRVAGVDGFEHAPGRDGWYTPWGGPPDVRSLAAAPNGTLYANVHVGGILRSADGGATWQQIVDIDLDVHQVVAGDGVVLAATARGLAVSLDDGRTWSIEDEGLHATYGRAVALAGDTVLLSVSTGPGGQRAAVYRRPLGGGRPFERCHAGLPATFGGNVDTFCLAADADLAALGTPGGRVYASGDAGATWSTVAAGPPVTCLSLA